MLTIYNKQPIHQKIQNVVLMYMYTYEQDNTVI